MVECVEGKYEPAKPSSFVCEPAAALIISRSGEVEVISDQCSMFLTHFRNFSGKGRTASLLDSELVVIGNETLSGNGGNFIRIQNPRDGLLAMKYIKQGFPTRGSPFLHTALASGNKLTVIGGKHKTRALLEEYSWLDINLKWEETNEHFVPNFFSACTVNDKQNSFYIFGGAQTIERVTSVRKTILHVNTTSLLVKVFGQMERPRMDLGCEFLSEHLFLLSGGYSDPLQPSRSMEPDEIFSINPSYTGHLLEKRKSNTLLKSILIISELQPF